MDRLTLNNTRDSDVIKLAVRDQAVKLRTQVLKGLENNNKAWALNLK